MANTKDPDQALIAANKQAADRLTCAFGPDYKDTVKPPVGMSGDSLMYPIGVDDILVTNRTDKSVCHSLNHLLMELINLMTCR